jgi:hypothetical protein
MTDMVVYIRVRILGRVGVVDVIKGALLQKDLKFEI